MQKLVAGKFPKAKWFVYEPVDFDIHREAATLAFGKPVKPYYRLDQAKRIVSLDCDFIGAEEDLPRLIRDFAKGRKIESPDKAQGEELINRLYVVESLLTLTGANADHRLRVPPSAVLPVAAALAAEVIPQGGGELAGALAALGKPAGVDPKWISECAKDLLAHQGNCVVVAGQRQPLAVHLLAHAMNAALGNLGKTVDVPRRAGAAGGEHRRTGAGAERRGSRDAGGAGRQPGLQRAGGAGLGGDAAQGQAGRAAGLLTRTRLDAAERLEHSRGCIIWNPGATRAPATARWCRCSR